jgi:hypothetical protein
MNSSGADVDNLSTTGFDNLKFSFYFKIPSITARVLLKTGNALRAGISPI